MEIHNTTLEAKIAARNKVNALALEMAPKMIAALAPFVGKKIINQGGGLAAKVRACLPDDPCTPSVSWWYSANNYSVSVNFKVCEHSKGTRYGKEWNGEICQGCIGNYMETHITLAVVDGNNLERLGPEPHLRTDYTGEAIQAARVALRAAQSALDDARSNLSGFGEYDQ